MTARPLTWARGGKVVSSCRQGTPRKGQAWAAHYEFSVGDVGFELSLG